MPKIKDKKRLVMNFDPSSPLTCLEAFGEEPTTMICVKLKGHTHLLPLTITKIGDGFADEIDMSLPEMVNAIISGVDIVNGNRKVPRRVRKRAEGYLPILVAGIMVKGGVPFSLIEVGEVHPISGNARARWYPADWIKTGDEFRVWLAKRDPYAAAGEWAA
jgi:hypothetical protein